MDDWTLYAPCPWVILKVLFGGIVIPTFIKTITLTYIIIDILIIIMSINISCKRLFTMTLRTYMTSPRSSISLKLISIITHTDTIIYIDIYIRSLIYID